MLKSIADAYWNYKYWLPLGFHRSQRRAGPLLRSIHAFKSLGSYRTARPIRTQRISPPAVSDQSLRLDSAIAFAASVAVKSIGSTLATMNPVPFVCEPAQRGPSDARRFRRASEQSPLAATTRLPLCHN